MSEIYEKLTKLGSDHDFAKSLILSECEKENAIIIQGKVDESLYKLVKTQIEKIDIEKPVKVVINSSGGSRVWTKAIENLFASIYQLAKEKEIPLEIDMFASTVCFSGGMILLLYGSRIHCESNVLLGRTDLQLSIPDVIIMDSPFTNHVDSAINDLEKAKINLEMEIKNKQVAIDKNYFSISDVCSIGVEKVNTLFEKCLILNAYRVQADETRYIEDMFETLDLDLNDQKIIYDNILTNSTNHSHNFPIKPKEFKSWLDQTKFYKVNLDMKLDKSLRKLVEMFELFQKAVHLLKF